MLPNAATLICDAAVSPAKNYNKLYQFLVNGIIITVSLLMSIESGSLSTMPSNVCNAWLLVQKLVPACAMQQCWVSVALSQKYLLQTQPLQLQTA